MFTILATGTWLDIPTDESSEIPETVSTWSTSTSAGFAIALLAHHLHLRCLCFDGADEARSGDTVDQDTPGAVEAASAPEGYNGSQEGAPARSIGADAELGPVESPRPAPLLTSEDDRLAPASAPGEQACSARRRYRLARDAMSSSVCLETWGMCIRTMRTSLYAATPGGSPQLVAD